MMLCECSFMPRLPWWWHHRRKIAASALWRLHLCKWRSSSWSSILIWCFCPIRGNVESWMRVQPRWTVSPASPRLGCIRPADAPPPLLALPGLGPPLRVTITAPRSSLFGESKWKCFHDIYYISKATEWNRVAWASAAFLPFPSLICRNVKNCSFNLLISTWWPESRWHHEELN